VGGDVTDPTSDGERCIHCERLLFPEQYANGDCGQCDAIPPLNPDCAGGKHGSCAGDAWDFTNDERADCGCVCHREGA
jgi:hypothetical protein